MTNLANVYGEIRQILCIKKLRRKTLPLMFSHGFVMFCSPSLIRFIIGQKVLPTYISNPFWHPSNFQKAPLTCLISPLVHSNREQMILHSQYYKHCKVIVLQRYLSQAKHQKCANNLVQIAQSIDIGGVCIKQFPVKNSFTS